MAAVIPALNPLYVAAYDLEEYFVNKDTGQPLANGMIFFYQDSNRVTPKNIFTLVDNPPNYNPPNYVALPNPITLSAAGTIVDNNGNNVPIYYYPYDAAGNLQLYYIVVKDQFGVDQLSRHAWPNITPASNPANTNSYYSNELSNPQFSQMLFFTNNPLTITNSSGAGTFTYNLFPAWTLSVTFTGNGSLTVRRNAVAGSSGLPGNPPFTVTITPGLNISAIQLIQTLSNNPDIFSPPVGGSNGWISASILLAPGSSIINMQYSPNNIVAQTQIILFANNTSGVYKQIDQTTQLQPAINPNTGDNGFVNIIINIPIVSATTLGNVQIIGLESNITSVNFVQTPINRQIDQLFNYYNPLLQYKPIPSYLIGWDFYYNPAQFLGDNLAASGVGANTSRYVWDQTIVFQSANNGPAISRSPDGALRITATNATQFALVQYLTLSIARKILNDSISSMVTALTPQAGGLVSTISLWYTTDANLPSCSANNSIVATLDANGYPITRNGNWVEVPRNGLGKATFTIGNSATTNFNDYGFNGWNSNGLIAGNFPIWFAIVVGTGTLNAGQNVDFQSISLVPGDVPTIPAPQSKGMVLADCQTFYEMSFNPGIIPSQNSGQNTGEFATTSQIGALAVAQPNYSLCFVTYKVCKNTSGVITTYNPTALNAQMNNTRLGNPAGDYTGTIATHSGQKGFCLSYTNVPAGGSNGDFVIVHWTSDSRLGR
jgi:hypothetical protein